MKLQAKIRISQQEDTLKNLVECFFGEEFNPKNILSIREDEDHSKKEIEIVLFFDNKPPTKTISAINMCDVIEENFIGDEQQKSRKEDVYKEETNLNVVKPQRQTAKISSSNSRKKTKKNSRLNHPIKSALDTTEESSAEIIIEFDRIANDSTSFEDFIKNVTIFFELGKRSDTFQKWVLCASAADTIGWKAIDNSLAKFEEVTYNTANDRHFCSKKIADKLKVQKIQLLSLFKILKKYKDFDYEVGKAVEELNPAEVEETESENLEIDSNKVSKDSTTVNTDIEETLLKQPKKHVKMEYMPEIESFEEILGNINKTLAIKYRIQYVLEEMGLEENKIITPIAKKNIILFATEAVKLKEISIEKASFGISVIDKLNETLISFSQVINNFIKRYDAKKKVKVLEFLIDLQKVVLTEEEYKRIIE